MALFVTDGNGTGLDADFSITGFSIEQPLEEALSVSVTAKPTASERAPSGPRKRRRCRRIRASVSPYAGNQSSKEQLTHENFHGQYRPNLDALGHGRHDQTGCAPSAVWIWQTSSPWRAGKRRTSDCWNVLRLIPFFLVDVLFAVCKPEADAKGITDEEFGRAMGRRRH